jgi:hypothetical protein
MALNPDGGPAPYSPTKNIITVVEVYRERGLQTPFTAETLARIGIGGALSARGIQSLRLLDLIDKEGNPTDTLQGLRLAPSDEFPARLADAIRAAYAPIFQFADPEGDTPERIRDAFRVYTPHGQQPRMVTLFIGVCEWAGIRPASAKSSPSTAATGTRKPSPARPRPASTTKRTETLRSGSGAKTPGPLLAMLDELPGELEWTQVQRDKWYTAFGVMLDFSVTILLDGASEKNGGDKGGEDD